MKNVILMLLLIGLFGSYASAAKDLVIKNAEDKAPIVAEADTSFGIDETTLYYLFSTIAQTLAGAFGILGVFAMYKLQSIENICQGIGDAIIQSHSIGGHLREVHNSYCNKDWNAFRESIVNKMAERNANKDRVFTTHYKLPEETINMHCVSLAELIESHNTIKKQIISALKLTVITIAYSLIVLPFSTAVAHYSVLSIGTVAIAIILSIKCLIDYSNLVINALGLRDKGKKKGESS